MGRVNAVGGSAGAAGACGAAAGVAPASCRLGSGALSLAAGGADAGCVAGAVEEAGAAGFFGILNAPLFVFFSAASAEKKTASRATTVSVRIRSSRG